LNGDRKNGGSVPEAGWIVKIWIVKLCDIKLLGEAACRKNLFRTQPASTTT
jgi:hypothetical protein